MGDHIQVVLGLFFSLIVAYVAFFGNWITLDATKAVIIFGTVIFGFAGWGLAIAVLAFFVTSSLLSRWNRVSRERAPEAKFRIPEINKRRDGYQIWANGFWMALFVFIWFINPHDMFLVAAFTALATANADTWSTEIGTFKPGKTVKINTFQPVKPGADGGISKKGTIASAAGSGLVAIFILFTGVIYPLLFLLLIFLFGFIGGLIDSWLGALIHDKRWVLNVPKDFSGNQQQFANSFVNWISTGASAILALITIQLLVI